MFSLFYAGKILAPQCTLDQGVNIQDYLQSHFLGAIQALVDRIHACDQEEDDDEEEEGKGSQETSKINLLEDQVVIGYDSWNEPSCGWIGLERLDVLPEQHDMRQGDMPTPLQSLMLGEGLVVQDVATYRLQLIGPVKSGSRAIDPSSHASFLSSSHQQQQQQQHPVKAWLTKERRDKLDREYGIQRDASFPRAGECLWAQLGVWSIKERKVLQQDYFARGPCPSSRSWSSSSLSPSTDALGATRKGAKISWVQDHWLPFARRVAEVVRRVHPTAILFLEPPVYVPPPDLLNAAASYDKDGAPPTVDATDELEVTNGSGQGQGQDPNAELMTNMAYAPHHYDDLVLLTKRYLGWINIDLLGLSRGRNKSLLGSIKLGQKNTRMLFGNQIQAIQKECYQRLGRRPVLIGETGLHFDVGLDKALQSGNSSIMPTSVSHGKATGKDQKQSTATATATSKRFQQAFDNILDGLDRTLVHYTLWNYTPENEALYGDGWNGENLSLYSLSAPSLLQDQDDASHRHHHHHHHLGYHHPLDRGGRAVEQFCRPYPIATVGSPVKLQLDRHAKIFRLWTRSHNNKAEVTPLPPLSPPPPSLTIKEAADTTKALDARTTVIYVPNFHFLGPAHCDVKVSDGSWEWDQEQQLVSWGYGRDETGDQHWIEIRRR
ncbi:hypothetical protein EDD11_009031 [Mortierella claussenii]|nr:hypothetical protein EDD11_009031 [Mortierella claussenii]